MASWSDRTTYQGRAVNRGTLAILTAANLMLATKKYGGETSPITLVQGGYNRGGVAASAGTHDGGGAIDITSFNWQNRIKVFRLLGVAIWRRPTIRGLWSEHLHGIVCGDGTASRGAKDQVTEYYNGGDGLVGSARDPNWRPKVFPLFHFYDGKHAPRYARVANSVYEQPTTSAKNLGAVKKGDKFNIVAIVVVSGKRWFVTADGKFGADENYTTTAPAEPSHKPNPAPKPVTRPAVKEIEKDAWWIVTKKTTGLDFPHKDFGKNLYAREPGFLLHTAGEAKVDGVWWDVSPHGTWYRQSDLVRTSAPIDTFTETYEAIRNCSLFEQPYDKSRRDGSLKKGEAFIATGKAIDQDGSGRVWYVNADHKWVCGVNVKKVDATDPKPASKMKLRIGQFNLPGPDKISNDTERVKQAVLQIKEQDLDLISLHELVGPGTDSKNNKPSVFATKLINGLGSDYSLITPTTAFNENYVVTRKPRVTLIDRPEDEKIYTAGLPGRHLTKTIIEHNATGREIFFGSTHLVDGNRPGAALQAPVVMAAAKKASSDRPIFIAGDMNTDETLKGFTDGGLKNARTAARKVVNADYATFVSYPKAKPAKDAKYIIDHIYVPKSWTVDSYEVVLNADNSGNFKKPRASDHMLVVIEVTEP